MKNAFVMLNAERVETGPIQQVAGAVQQETRMYAAGECVCVLLVTFPAGSPEWAKWNAARTLDTEPFSGVRTGSVASDVRNCETCAHGNVPNHQEPCSRCTVGVGPGGGHEDNWERRGAERAAS